MLYITSKIGNEKLASKAVHGYCFTGDYISLSVSLLLHLYFSQMTGMEMDGNDQEAMGSQEMARFIEGKRTKRWRPTSPMGLAMTSTSSSTGGSSTLSPRSSAEFAESTAGEEEEEMANFLILLASGHQAARKSSEHTVTDLSISTGKQGRQRSNVYQCKTCNRCFPSFQALGGHRTSHKKPEPNIEGKKAEAGTIIEELEEDHQHHNSNIANTTLPLGMAQGRSLCSSNVNSSKVHECSICGAEFSSGQALGGHMRRHKALTVTTISSTAATTTSLGRISPEGSQKSKKPTNSLQLDLNLPAPEADLRESKFPFASEEKVVIFSAFCSG